MADRAKKARARREALLLGMIQDAAREALSKAMAARVRARRLTLLLGITRDAASDAWLKVTAARVEKARARRVALILGIVQDAACDAMATSWVEHVARNYKIPEMSHSSCKAKVDEFLHCYYLEDNSQSIQLMRTQARKLLFQQICVWNVGLWSEDGPSLEDCWKIVLSSGPHLRILRDSA